MVNDCVKIAKIIPHDVEYSIGQISDIKKAELFPIEQILIKDSQPKRQREFIAGRDISRQLLKKMGIEKSPILSGTNKEPLWPKDIVGSISHSDNHYFVALAKSYHFKGLGIDIETDKKISEDIKKMICTKEELEHIKHLTEINSEVPWVNIFFSSKESVYKCVYPLMKKFIDFKEIEIHINHKKNRFQAHPVTTFNNPYHDSVFEKLKGRFYSGEGYVLSLASLNHKDHSTIYF